MILLNIITFSALIGVMNASGQQGAIQLVINLPNVMEQLMQLNNYLFGYGTQKKYATRSGTIEDSEENKEASDEEDAATGGRKDYKAGHHTKDLRETRRQEQSNPMALMDQVRKRNQLYRNFNKKYKRVQYKSSPMGNFDADGQPRVMVESVMGGQKVYPVSYPKDYLKKKFRYLVKMKNKQEERDKTTLNS